MANELNDDDFGNRETNGHPINGKLPDLVQAMNNVFGGPGGFAREVKSVYDAAPNGGNVRAAVMRSVLNMHEEAYRLDGRGDDSLEQLSDEQLQEIEDTTTRATILANPTKWLPTFREAVASLHDPSKRDAIMREVAELEDQVDEALEG